ncbi:MAG: hypothetical protein ACK45H_09220, partial [Bacteroidota bacterium]
MKKILLFAHMILAITWVSAQQTYFIRDRLSQEAVPFVKVYPDQGSPFLGDLDGAFSVQTGVQSVTLKVSSFRDTTVNLSDSEDHIIFLQPIVQEIQEVTATAGENP